MRSHLWSRVLTLSLVCCLTGCATVFNSGSTSLELLVFEPDTGVDVKVTNLRTEEYRDLDVKHEAEIKLQHDANYELLVGAPGFLSHRYTIDRQLSPWLWGDVGVVAVGGLLYASGAAGAFTTSASFGTLNNLFPIIMGAFLVGGGIAALGFDASLGNFFQHDTRQLRVSLVRRTEEAPNRPHRD